MATIVIHTQYMENYGAHDWNGEGACPQYWKAKGGSDYKVHVDYDVDYEWMDVIVDRVLAQVRETVEWSDDYSESYILDVTVEEDGWLSRFEKSQLEYDGEIVYPEPTLLAEV